ncbi:hypothetical protein CCR82_10260 [Halochromatium salexigens]|uniref:Lcl C-terminal domain-containing protein n=2 Tax=Halochromatium salexigens TaxID=49447 RepID=A0AAJ0UG90_HALSE|nr:hypothetical protein [Halochromatium salexigens]
MKRVLKAVSDLKADEIGADDIGDGLATVGAVLTNYLKNSATDAIKNIRKIALQAVAELPHYFMGTKAAKIALVANKFAGLATAQFLTPDEIPFSIEVDENGELDFTYPRLSVIGAESSLIPLGEEDTKSIFTGNLTAGQNVNRVHPFVVSDQKEPPLYLPRYRLYFEHSKRELKDQIFDAAEWRGDVAVNLVLNLGRYEDEFVSGEPALFGGSENRVIKGFKPSDLARHIKEDSDEISSIELINVLGESNKSWWEFLSDDFNLGSVSVVNKTRGIFRESFGYDIFEPIGGRLENRATRFDLDHRYVFKTASLRDLRPGLALISERHDDGSYDLIVYNKSVGHNVTVLILDDEIDPTVLQSYLLKPRESLRFDPLQHENSTFLIFDHVVSGYSEFLDHGNVLQTLHAMAGLKELSFEKFLGEYGKFVGEATSNIPLDPHHFILRASSASHFDDPAENGGIEVSSDWLQSITEETHAFLRVNDNDRAGYYFAPVSQHAVKWLDDDYLVLNRVSSPLIQTTDLQTEQIRNTLVGKYGALDLHLQGITPWQDDDGQVIGITDNRGNRYRLLTYNERTDGKIEIRLQPEMDKNRLFECKSAWMSCAPLSWIDNFSYDLLITDAEIYSDSDGDAIINELDAFPDDERWHADTSGDGLPDQFIRNLRLDINNRYAELDLNGDGDTVMDAFLNDGHPLMLATPWLQLELAPGDGAVIARWEPVEPGIGSVERYDLSYKKIDEVVGLGNTLEDVTSPHRLEGLETGERYRVRLDIVTSEGFTLFTEEPLYFGPTGSLQVTLRPDEAVAAGAQWRRANTYSWFDSEQTETNIPIGAQTVEFKDIGDDWEVPSDATVSISVGETTPLTGRYTPVDDDDPTPPTATYPLNDTGIDWCADGNTNNLDCSDTAFDFPGQDGEYGRDALAREGRLDKVGAGHAGFDFTKLDANGDPLSIQDAAWSDDGREIDGTRWSCVRDNHTGLIWEVKTDDDGLRDKDHEYTWYNPETNGGRAGTQDGGSCNQSDCDTHAYVQAVNEQGLCGAKDWRLPSVDELLSIVSNDRTDPAIDTNYFPNARSSRFWSSSPVASASNGAWVVHFDHGSVYNDGYVNGDLPVRLVRAGQ